MQFFIPSRLTRLNYLLRLLAFSLLTWPLENFFDDDSPGLPKILALLLVGLIIVSYWLMFIVRPRCKDAGMRWGWMFLMLVPLVNLFFGIILLFAPTQPMLDPRDA